MYQGLTTCAALYCEPPGLLGVVELAQGFSRFPPVMCERRDEFRTAGMQTLERLRHPPVPGAERLGLDVVQELLAKPVVREEPRLLAELEDGRCGAPLGPAVEIDVRVHLLEQRGVDHTTTDGRGLERRQVGCRNSTEAPPHDALNAPGHQSSGQRSV